MSTHSPKCDICVTYRLKDSVLQLVSQIEPLVHRDFRAALKRAKAALQSMNIKEQLQPHYDENGHAGGIFTYPVPDADTWVTAHSMLQSIIGLTGVSIPSRFRPKNVRQMRLPLTMPVAEQNIHLKCQIIGTGLETIGHTASAIIKDTRFSPVREEPE